MPAQLLITGGPGAGQRRPLHPPYVQGGYRHQPVVTQCGEGVGDVARYQAPMIEPVITHPCRAAGADASQRHPVVQVGSNQREPGRWQDGQRQQRPLRRTRPTAPLGGCRRQMREWRRPPPGCGGGTGGGRRRSGTPWRRGRDAILPAGPLAELRGVIEVPAALHSSRSPSRSPWNGQTGDLASGRRRSGHDPSHAVVNAALRAGRSQAPRRAGMQAFIEILS